MTGEESDATEVHHVASVTGYDALRTGGFDENLVTGIIRDVHLGTRDTNLPVLWFTVYISESSCALTVIPWDDAHDIVGRFTDFRALNNYPCWCDVATQGIIR